MSPWWGKPSCIEVKQKTNRRSFIGTFQRIFTGRLEDKKYGKSGESGKYYADTSPKQRLSLSDSALPSQVSRYRHFAEQTHAQPLPLPALDSPGVGHAVSEHKKSSLELHGSSKPSPNSYFSRNGCDREILQSSDAWCDLGTASRPSTSSNSSDDTNDQPGSQLLSSLAIDYESGNVTAINSPSWHMDQSSIITRRILKDQLKPVNHPTGNDVPYTFSKHGPFGSRVTKLKIAPRAGFFSAPGSFASSPSRSSVNAYTYEQIIKSGSGVETSSSDMYLVGSGHCYSEKNVGHDPRSDCCPQNTPPSPRMISPNQGSFVQSGVVTPTTTLHPSTGRICTELCMGRPDAGKPESHKLPLPPVTACSSCPFSSSYVAVKTPPRRNNLQPEPSASPVSRWKKGRLLGNGAFGHVYLGFNSETGEMCAMKEVTLFSDDSRSMESSQQLRHEITLMSHLSHPNIVRYIDSEMVDNKLYIYLEYVSGGSVNKILREYGELRESAIRSYTRQILSGLAYLHSKNTAHRDIKGANILVDPSGQVKLADFGVAKHITGKPCPFSLKGSPYWMAPEVVKNSNGCSLAVDIWSLGCTVIEMATAKPPWSQYEGVAALFKIGNSKELPPTPDHLSEEGKDFIWQCLQRNPEDRPTAVQLLGHPFVRNIASPKRCSVYLDPLGPHSTLCDAEGYKGMGHAKTIASLDLVGVDVELSRGIKNGSSNSKHISCPVSPIGGLSPLSYPLSSQPMNRRRNTVISSPQTASGSSTPCTGGKFSFPVKHSDHSLANRKPQKRQYAMGSPLYCKGKLEALSGIPEVFRVDGDVAPCHCNFVGGKLEQFDRHEPENSCNRQTVLANYVSQQILMGHHLS